MCRCTATTAPVSEDGRQCHRCIRVADRTRTGLTRPSPLRKTKQKSCPHPGIKTSGEGSFLRFPTTRSWRGAPGFSRGEEVNRVGSTPPAPRNKGSSPRFRAPVLPSSTGVPVQNRGRRPPRLARLVSAVRVGHLPARVPCSVGARELPRSSVRARTTPPANFPQTPTRTATPTATAGPALRSGRQKTQRQRMRRRAGEEDRLHEGLRFTLIRGRL